MLFASEWLHSKYDFGNKVDDASVSISSLSKEIAKVSSRIFDMIDEGKRVAFYHHDLQDHEIFVQTSVDDSLKERDYVAIQNILYRNPQSGDRHTAISTHLSELGISDPTGNLEDKKKYLQLLYFFYMLRYFAFPDFNVFHLFQEKRRSTYFSPNSAAGGEYLHFIMSNLFDEKPVAVEYLRRDKQIAIALNCIADDLERAISEKYDMADNEARAREIRRVINYICNTTPEYRTTGNPIDRMLDIVYQYQMLAYSGDMLKNLEETANPYYFKELEYDIDRNWKNRLLKTSEVDAFLQEPDTLEFCRQEIITDERPEKKARGNPFEFVHTVIAYDQFVADNGHKRLFTKEVDGQLVIPADIAAIIVRTYFDCNSDLLMVFRSNRNWKEKQKLRRALSINIESVEDLAMRQFVVAFHSEYLNTYAGHGYYYALFKPIYLQRYKLLQEMVYSVYSEPSRESWSYRMLQLLKIIDH